MTNMVSSNMRFCPENHEIPPLGCHACGINCNESEYSGCLSCLYRARGRCCNSMIDDREIRIIRVECPHWKTLQIMPAGKGRGNDRV